MISSARVRLLAIPTASKRCLTSTPITPNWFQEIEKALAGLDEGQKKSKIQDELRSAELERGSPSGTGV